MALCIWSEVLWAGMMTTMTMMMNRKQTDRGETLIRLFLCYRYEISAMRRLLWGYLDFCAETGIISFRLRHDAAAVRDDVNIFAFDINISHDIFHGGHIF